LLPLFLFVWLHFCGALQTPPPFFEISVYRSCRGLPMFSPDVFRCLSVLNTAECSFVVTSSSLHALSLSQRTRPIPFSAGSFGPNSATERFFVLPPFSMDLTMKRRFYTRARPAAVFPFLVCCSDSDPTPSPPSVLFKSSFLISRGTRFVHAAATVFHLSVNEFMLGKRSCFFSYRCACSFSV